MTEREKIMKTTLEAIENTPTPENSMSWGEVRAVKAAHVALKQVNAIKNTITPKAKKYILEGLDHLSVCPGNDCQKCINKAQNILPTIRSILRDM